MQTENLEFLQKQLLYKGFKDEQLIDNLKVQMESGVAQFELPYKEQYERTDGKKNDFDATLHFKKGKDNELYYFNGFDAVLTKATGEQVKQCFYNAGDKSFTKKEAYNLLDGRAVKKEIAHDGKKFEAYLQLDFEKQSQNGNYYFKSFHEKYGFDTAASLSALPIKIKDEKTKDELVKSLNKGNIQQVTLDNNQQLFAAIDPQYKKIQLSDAHERPVIVERDAASNNLSVHYPTKHIASDKEPSANQEVEKPRGMKL